MVLWQSFLTAVPIEPNRLDFTELRTGWQASACLVLDRYYAVHTNDPQLYARCIASVHGSCPRS